jgi:hypothetical protein
MIEKIEDGLSDGETEEYTSSFSEYEINIIISDDVF